VTVGIAGEEIDGLVTEDVFHDGTPSCEVAEGALGSPHDERVPLLGITFEARDARKIDLGV